MFWQGGFFFYAAVVVPVGQSVLGSHLEQGMITRQVTTYLNLSGIGALAIFAWEGAFATSSSKWKLASLWSAWLVMAGCLLALFWLHGILDAMIDVDAHELLEPKTFRPLHRVYLWISTVQWVAGLAWTALMLENWRRASPAR
jgi:hypothetical protein